MRQRVISLECGLRQLAQARDALDALPGVIAAELVPGRRAIRVFQGDEPGEGVLLQALGTCGLHNAQID